jgi:hypothetical protein
VLSSWPLTRGLPLALLVLLLSIWAPLMFSGVLVSSALITAVGGTETSIPAGGALAAAVILGVVVGGAANPLTDAALAYVYRAARRRAGAP